MSSRCYDELCVKQDMDGLLFRFKVLFTALAVAAIVALAVYGSMNADIPDIGSLL